MARFLYFECSDPSLQTILCWKEVIKMRKMKLVLVLSLALLLLVCGKTKNPVTVPGEASSDFEFKSVQSSCGQESFGKMAKPIDGDTVIFSAHGDTIFVTHKAFYNCCSEIATDVVQTAEGFDLFERDTSEGLCDCMCDFDITTTISGVSEGEYVVRLFNIYGNLVDSAVVTVYGYVVHRANHRGFTAQPAF
jgi:hypothetical protein